MSTNPDCSSIGCKPPSFEIDIERLIPHPSYDRRTHHNDIGLVKLAQNVIFADHIRPICLLVNQTVVRSFTSFDFTGWGKTKTSETSEKLQTATLNNLNRSICETIFSMPMNESQICGGSLTSDACVGDAGAPLTAQLVYGKIYRVFQFGITSFGIEDCLGFGAYTNVTHYINWIENTINENLTPFISNK
uniref:Serine protease easter-like n=1 Tax=Drosophila rhopaloa TaxID=1041015 RepID=A0A6P4F8E1_DRORH